MTKTIHQKSRQEGKTLMLKHLLYSEQLQRLRDIRTCDVDLRLISAALAKQCRFNGRTPEFYSVAQHCVIVSQRFVDPDLARAGLLHDAIEYWLGDQLRPISEQLHYYVEGTGDLIEWQYVEADVMKPIARRYDLPWPLPREVREADDRVLATEEMQFFGATTIDAEPVPGLVIEPVDWQRAERMFVDRAVHLGLLEPE
jgi:hypothetical protein